MKTITQLFTALIFMSLMIFASCGGGDDDDDDTTGPDARIELGNNLVKVVTGAPSAVTFDGDARDEWDAFSLTFTFDETTFGGTYATSGVPDLEGADTVWGSNGSWSFNESGSTITAGSNTITATISGSSASLAFSNAGSRAASFSGAWVFTW